MASPPKLPVSVTAEQIGELLQKEYGEEDPNTPINYFMILLDKQSSGKLKEGKGKGEFLASIEPLKINAWRPIHDGWGARKLLFFKFDDTFNHEREREDAINLKVREFLKKEYEDSINIDAHIIFSRACLYYEPSSCLEQPDQHITTREIGRILKSEYSIGDVSIDYFYLIIQVEEDDKSKHMTEVNERAYTILNRLPGEWRCLDEEDWPGVYFGYYPKTSLPMTEREREMNLNKKVRQPLSKELELELKSKAKVHIILTRACEYNKK